MPNPDTRPDWIVIGDWAVYRYSQFLFVVAALLFAWWVVRP